MTNIYIIRHCEAEGNAKRIFQGTTDCDISATGAHQLEYLKKRFENIEIDSVYSSPLIRARKTAEAVAFPKKLEITTLEGLRELDGGIVEGKPFAATFQAIPGLADIWDNHPQDFAPEGGEPMRDAYERIFSTLLEIERRERGKTVAVATHGGVIRALLCRLLYGSIDRLRDVGWSENTAVSLITFDESQNPTIVFRNDFSHVPEEFMPKRNRMANVKAEKQ